jgi:hypothetical protein
LAVAVFGLEPRGAVDILDDELICEVVGTVSIDVPNEFNAGFVPRMLPEWVACMEVADKP